MVRKKLLCSAAVETCSMYFCISAILATSSDRKQVLTAVTIGMEMLVTTA